MLPSIDLRTSLAARALLAKTPQEATTSLAPEIEKGLLAVHTYLCLVVDFPTLSHCSYRTSDLLLLTCDLCVVPQKGGQKQLLTCDCF